MKVKATAKNMALLTYIVFLATYVIQTSQFYNENEWSRVVIYVLYGLGYMIGLLSLIKGKGKYNLRSLLWCASLLAVGILVFVNTYWVDIIAAMSTFNLFFLIVCSKNLSFDEVIKADLRIRIISTMLLFLMSITGIITNVITYRDDGLTRYAFGYGHANRFGIAIFLIVLYYQYIKRNNITWKNILIQIAALFLVYRIANSRSATIGVLAVLFYTFSILIGNRYKNTKKSIKRIRNISLIALFLMIVLIFYSSFNYSDENTFIKSVNSLLNSRLVLGSLYSNYYGVSLFGSAVRMYTWSDVLSLGLNRALTSIDIMYLMIFFRYGLVTLAIYIYMLIFVIRFSSKIDKTLLVSVALICILASVENQFYSPTSNIYILIFANKIFKKECKMFGQSGKNGFHSKKTKRIFSKETLI